MDHRSEQPGAASAPQFTNAHGGDGIDNVLIEAINYHNAGRTREAEALYLSLATSGPGHVLAHHGIGLLRTSEGRFQEAIESYNRAIAARPEFVDAYINLGVVHLTLGQCNLAARLFRVAIELRPDDAIAYCNLGKASQDLGQVDEALACYRRAIELQPDNATAHANLGAALLEQRAWSESLSATRRAIDLRPDDPITHANMATAQLQLSRHDEALAACRRAASLCPRDVMALASLAGVMLELGSLPEAVTLSQRAIALDPNHAPAWFNLSHALKGLNRLGEAITAANAAVILRSDWPEYHLHLAHLLLIDGDLANAWTEYEWRLKLPDFAWLNDTRNPPVAHRWEGEDIRDRTILICAEQGIGDVVLFARFLPSVVARAGHVVVAAQPSMGRLLSSIHGVTIIPLRDRQSLGFDLFCPLASLPRLFATKLTDVRPTMPYLRVDSERRARWARRLRGDASHVAKVRVGIVWSGNPLTKRDRFRSPGLRQVAPLFELPGIQYVVLQVGPGRDDLGALPLPPDVLDLGAEVEDLTDTAAIMSELDLMISSCTGPLHLAGGLGVKTWAMIPFAPYFPWLLNRDDTPWYPTVRLYRQDQPGTDWTDVVRRIARDLMTIGQQLNEEQASG